MRVICINEKYNRPSFLSENPKPVCGNTYTVVAEYYFESFILEDNRVMAGVYYQLIGFGDEVFHSRNFATLPDRDADEMQEEEREGIVNLEKSLV